MKKLITFFMTGMLSIGMLSAQELSSPVPQDSKTIVGKLPNGITYYIRHNQEPKDRASFYIIQNVGALLENDDQNGLAHFLEHMAFNGTKNFPGKGIIKGLEKHGVEFGRNVNAYTAFDETVYNISSVPTTQESLLDTCLLILHDWCDMLQLEDAEIDSERGVISEEWRTRRNARFRIQMQTLPVLLAGSKYEVRDVIGDLNVIKNFKYKTLRDFYHDWYRTDLQAIAVVGDFDAKQMEQKIQKLFASIKPIDNPKPRPFFEVPENIEPRFALATDKEAQSSSIAMTIRHKAADATVKNSHQAIKDDLIIGFYNAMLGARISELMQKGNPPFVNGGIGFGGFVRGYNAYNISTTAKPNEEAEALRAILTENERVRRYGFSQSELDRVKANTLAGLESSYKQKDKIDNDSYASEMQSHYLEQEPLMDFDYYYDYATKLIPQITVEEVSAKAKEWYTPENRVVIIQGPSENAKHLTKEETFAIIEEVEKSEIAKYDDGAVGSDLIEGDLVGGKIISTKEIPQFGAKEWTLDNNIKVIYKKADYEKDEVTLASYSKGGTSLYSVDMLPAASNAAGMIGAYGLGDYDAVALKKIMAGKMANCGVNISGLSESVSGASTPADVETMLQLMYLRFTKPRFDADAHQAMMSRNYAQIDNMQKNPSKIMRDSMNLIVTNYNERTLLFNREYLDKITLDKVEKVYRERFANPADFTFFIVGNIDEEQLRPLVEKYFGSLQTDKSREKWVDNKVRRPKGKVEKEIEIALETPKATVQTLFEKQMPYSVQYSVYNRILKGILDLRYTENIREKEGGTYGVGVSTASSMEPYASYSVNMAFDCDPDKAKHLKSLIYKEIDEIVANGPTAEEVDKVVKNMKKNHEQSKNHNSYWLNNIYSYYVTGIDGTNPKNFDNIVDNVTPKDIQKFTKKLFGKADVVDIIFKPKQ
ncbi:MAG: M16 family metallopeptidase [Marinifilaceae bacterium]